MKDTNLRKRPHREDKQFQHDIAQLLEPGALAWLERLERESPIAFTPDLPRAPAAYCRESGWTQVRIVQPEYRVLHELTDQGRSVLRDHRRVQRLLNQ